ncbi:hypothetical protein GCM10028781_05130 [Nostocoides australiense]
MACVAAGMNTRSAATLVLAGLVLAGCSAGLGPEGDRVNARAYYDDYQEAEADGANNYSVGAAAPNATGQAAGAASPHPADAGKRYGWPGVTDDNTFTDEGSSRWTPVRTRPQSTFALDVDTGSYQVARTFLRDGYRPPAESIRVEEWINAFDYGDPAPIGKDAVRVGADSGVSPYGAPGTALVRIGVSTRTATTAQGPTHVTFVVDTSGSMDIRERLGLVQSSLALLVNNLEPEDTIAIVEYGSEARRVLPPTKVRDSDRIVAAIDKLRPSGSTNMEAGLELGYRQAEAAYDPDGVNAVVLASDGVANVGVTESSTLTDTITQASSKGIHLVTVGYGMGNYNDTLMEQLADHGDGFYSYVDDFTEAQRLFVDELTPTLTVVASDAKAKVSFDPEFVGSYRLIGYENRGLHNDDYTDDAVDAGELGAGHAVSALYEIKPANAVPAAGTVVGTAGIRWATTDGGKGKEVRADIAWPQAGQQSPSLRLAALVAATAEYLRGEATGEDADLEALRADARALAAADVSGARQIEQFLADAASIDPSRVGG